MNKLSEDKTLISSLKVDDENALAIVYQKYSKKIFDSAVFILKDTGWSEDIVQEVFIKFWKSRTLLNESLPIWPFLYTLTKRETLNKLKSIKSSKVAFELLLKHSEISADTVNKKIEDKEAALHIYKQLSKLSPQQQIVFKLSKIDGISQQEIADELHISKNTVKNHMAQAVKFLRKVLADRVILPLIAFLFL